MNLIEEIDNNKNIINEYFRLQTKYSKLYGINNTILFLQVGSFHEAYQTNEEGFDLIKISELLNIIVSKKNKSILEVSNKNPFMLGFPSIALSKFLKILIDYGFNVVIGDQITPPPNPKRAITGIYSPGTYLDDNIPDANNIISIYIEEIEDFIKKKENLITGISLIDLTTGKSLIHEILAVKNDNNYILDEIFRFITSFSIKEIIITSNNLKKYKLDDIINYLEINDKIYKHQTITQLIDNNKKSIYKLNYQQEFLKKIYPEHGYLSPIEYLDLENKEYGRLSFIILLSYAYDHSHNIINNLNKPIFYEDNKHLYLGNNAIYQLNLITFDKNNQTGLFSNKVSIKSVFDLINKTSTAIGHRFLKENLCNPLNNIDLILERYNIINILIEKKEENNIDKLLFNIYDIEKLYRKISLLIINPIEFYKWILSLDKILELLNYIYKKNLFENYKELILKLIKFINTKLLSISKLFLIEELQKYYINDISGKIFHSKSYEDIDELLLKINKCEQFITAIASFFSKILETSMKIETDNNFIKIDYNERDGHFLSLTKRRAEILESVLKENKNLTFKYNNINYEINCKLLEFKYLPKGNNAKIFIKEIMINSSKILEYQDQLKNLQKKYFCDFLNILRNDIKEFTEINNLIGLIDFLNCGAKIASKYHYTIPIIDNKYNNKSYFKAEELRHPIIERINKNEYIPISLELGTENQDGILLFGLNSAGKSSLQKAIGINIILAQMGYPVASKEFIYYPYESLFTRISSNDNLFKGLSSFSLELTEIKNIIKKSNQNTLVIADEVCRGTENKSSLIIVMAIIEILSKLKTSFISATHLHDIINFEQLHKLKNIKLYHLHITYDEINNNITYDRLLKSGSGDSFYGLNIAKFLINDNNFIEIANSIKNEYFGNNNIFELKTSNYNSNIIMDKCYICYYIPKKNEIPLETHHINFQKNFINGFNKDKFHLNKNQDCNLVVLCSKCHDKIDKNKIVINGWTDYENKKLNFFYNS